MEVSDKSLNVRDIGEEVCNKYDVELLFCCMIIERGIDKMNSFVFLASFGDEFFARFYSQRHSIGKRSKKVSKTTAEVYD
jgi:hypothetical protein